MTLTHAGSGRKPDGGANRSGEFVFPSLGIEPVVLTATAADGSLACITHAGLLPGTELNDLRLVLDAPTAIEVDQRTSYEWVYVEVMGDSFVVASDWAQRGGLSPMKVPPGELTLPMSGQKDPEGGLEELVAIETKTVTAAAGDTLKVTVGRN